MCAIRIGSSIGSFEGAKMPKNRFEYLDKDANWYDGE